jgi:hypothetical protein
MERANENSIDAHLLLKTTGKIFSYLLTAWFLICIALTANSELKSYLLSKSQDALEYKNQCVSQGGKVRHDESLIGVNIYCMRDDGGETVFVFSGTDSSFAVALADRLLFGYFSLQSHFESLENESK